MIDFDRISSVAKILWENLNDFQKSSVPFVMRALSVQLSNYKADEELCPDANSVLGDIHKSCIGEDIDGYRELFINAMRLVGSTDQVISVSQESYAKAAVEMIFPYQKRGNVKISVSPLETILDTVLKESINVETIPVEESQSEDTTDAEEGNESDTGEGTEDKGNDSPDTESTVKDKDNADTNGDDDEGDDEPLGSQFSEVYSKWIKKFFDKSVGGYLNTIMARYALLFESGYDLTRPYGFVTSEGVVYVNSEGSRVERPIDTGFDGSQSMDLYAICKQVLGFDENFSRTPLDLVGALKAGYGNKTLLYFPFKLMEVAYGRAARKDKPDRYSYVRYNDESYSSNWGKYSAYYRGKLEAFIWYLIEVYCRELGIDENLDERGLFESLQNKKDDILGFVNYAISCLSVCPLIVEYKYSLQAKAPVSLKLRLCDPRGNIPDNADIMGQICSKLGFQKDSSEAVALGSSLNEVDSKANRVFEYAHEFNHQISHAMPLFAYKAYEALKAKGVNSIKYKDMILGQGADGKIVKNGGNVKVAGNLMHFINAGSRSGKGVMTLNMVSSAIVSNKAIIYLDNKPDMIVVLSQMCGDGNNAYPPMFALNGSNLIERNQGVFANSDNWVNPNNIPLEARTIFQSNASMQPDWRTYGDLFYLRASTLAMGMILGRGMEGSACKDRLNGEDGIFLVCDESSVLQTGFAEMMKQVYNTMPPASTSIATSMNNIIELVKEINSSEKSAALQKKLRALVSDLSPAFQSSNFYALSLVNYLKDNMDFLGSLSKASFNQKEYEYSDILIIGQDLETLSATSDDLGFITNIGRYKTSNGVGLPKESLKIVSAGSIPLAQFTSLGKADALIGYNAYQPEYLKQINPESKAYGKLDAAARNFCYIPSEKISPNKGETLGKQISSLALANSPSVTYFKPYLLLNDYSYDPSSGVYCRYAEDMFGFSARGGAGRDDIIAEYPSDVPGVLNPAVGLPQYMELMGISKQEVANRLRKGADLANIVVGEYLGYPDNGSGMPLWLQFVTDLRPEWMLSLRDIAHLCNGNTGSTNVTFGKDNKITKEYYRMLDFKQEYGDVIGLIDETMSCDGNTYIDENGNTQYDTSRSENIENDFNAWDDGSDMDAEEEEFQARTESIFREPEEDYAKEDEVFDDIFGDAKAYNQMGSYIGEVEQNTGNPEVDMLLAQIAELTRKVQELSSRGSNTEYKQEGVYAGYENNMQPVSFTPESFGDIEYEEDTGALTGDSLCNIISAVSERVISEFGDVSRIHSVRVCGGALVINNEVVTCNLDRGTVGILPLDIRKQVATGNISELLDYRYLKLMPNLRVLQFDSASFVYDIVNPYLGFTRSLGVNSFFTDFKSLQSLVIGKYSFTREGYKADIKSNQLFEQQSKAEKLAVICTKGSAKATKACASFTRNSMRNKTTMGKVFGVTAGVVSTAVTGAVTGMAGMTTGVAKGVAKVRRRVKSSKRIARGVKTIKSSIKGLFDE